MITFVSQFLAALEQIEWNQLFVYLRIIFSHDCRKQWLVSAKLTRSRTHSVRSCTLESISENWVIKSTHTQDVWGKSLSYPTPHPHSTYTVIHKNYHRSSSIVTIGTHVMIIQCNS